MSDPREGSCEPNRLASAVLAARARDGRSARGGPAAPPSARPTPTPRLAGRTIAGRYEILGLAGRGGLSRVFRVRHTSLGKQFALKVMNADLSGDEERRALFYREAQVASALMHPNVVSVVDFGEDETAGAYMVMEYVEGESLAERLHRHRRGLPPKVFCDVLLQLAEALHYIHTEGVIHGDIKAENAICWRVQRSSRRPWQLKILDFGLAFLESSDTLPATVGGTPEYIAPERLRGAPPHVATDIYSLGILGYELLTGNVPFTGETEQVIEQQLYADPPPISARRGEPVDKRIDALIRRAIAKDPSARHDGMEAFLYELRTVMDMLGISHRPRVMSATAPAPARDVKQAAAAAAFQRAPFGMAGINVDGAVVVGNRAFAKFLTGDKRAPIPEDALLSSRLLEHYPSLLRDLRRVHVKGVKARKELVIPGRDGSQRRLTVVMAPGDGSALGDVHVTVLAGHFEDEVAAP